MDVLVRWWWRWVVNKNSCNHPDVCLMEYRLALQLVCVYRIDICVTMRAHAVISKVLWCIFLRCLLCGCCVFRIWKFDNREKRIAYFFSVIITNNQRLCIVGLLNVCIIKWSANHILISIVSTKKHISKDV